MNERIEKLIVEAFFDEATNGSGQKMYTLGEEKIQKFAELIVQECSRIADGWVNNEDNGKNYPSDKIKQHFGVEE
jgi:hypothetical protein